MENSSSPKTSFDPGWNDPPNLSYNGQQTVVNKPRNLLNKRVAFPLSGSAPMSSTLPSVNLPPAPFASISSHLQFNPKNSLGDELIDIDSEKALEEVKLILLKLLEESEELGPKAIDIRKRIDIMEDMWKSDKLNKKVHLLMRNLANAIKENEHSKADEIHRALMVDHVALVATWMPGVKRLLYNNQARNELLAMDKEEG